MNKRFLLTLIVVSLCNLYVNAQSGPRAKLDANFKFKMLSIEDALNYGRTTLAPEKLASLQWIKDSHKFSYLKNSVLIIKNAENNSEQATVSLKELNKQLSLVSKDTLKKFPTYTWESEDVFTFYWSGFLMEYSLKKGKATASGYFYDITKFENADMSPIKHRFAHTEGNNLLIYDNKEKINVSTDGNDNLVYGQTVHRSEFGINKGTFWNNSGSSLAFYRMDQTNVTNYPIIDWSKTPAESRNIKYPFAGNASHTVTVGVFNVATRSIVYLNTGEPKEQYLTNIAWSPDDKFIFIAVLNRDQNELKMNQYNAETGEFVKTLFEEKDAKYIQPLHPIMFLKSATNQFVWQSRRDGFNHLYHYDINGKLIKQLTKGRWEITEVFGVDSQGKDIYYSATINGAVNSDVCKTNIISGITTIITQGNGTNYATLSTDKKYILNQFSNITTPRITSIINTENKKQTDLLRAANPLVDYELGDVSLFNIKNKEGDTLYCRMFKPINFDENKKYPVLVYLYGGPNTQLVRNTWLAGAEVWYHYMAEQGFIVFTLDNRGSGNRGAAFEQATFRKLGTAECEDQMEGVKYLKSLKYVDASRMGVHGWSFGGFMTTSLMTRYPDVFKAGVAGGPVTDWRNYEIMYTERYMDTPQSNPEGYKKSSLFEYNQNLKGKLMMIHGTDDDVVVWQHSINYVNDCVKKGIQLDYFVYPNHLHNVIGKDRAHLYKKVTDYFIKNL